MNFQDLRIIIGQIKKNVSCPKCKGKYKDADIEVIGSLGDEQNFFHAICSKCQSESIINVAIQFDSDGLVVAPNLKKLGAAPRMEQISSNEVLDMHNFLKAFDGDFSELFKKKEKRKS